MRYSVYKFLRGISDSLLDAITYIKNNPSSANILVDCIEGILSIKDSLKVNGCNELEELDKALQKIDEIADCIENGQEYITKLNDLLQFALAINEYCKNKIKYKFRIVFFAELGSKWDSMDSIYRAYKNREDCDVAVVLAPIYRAVRLPSGEVKSDVIYTDYLTELGIEHIPFQQYDIKKDMPDMVFTSQPYESVTPDMFWAENIAPYTRLVYLPYYTSAGFADDEQKYVQCQMPIHKLAWKVICQSEKAKEVYSKYSPVKGKNLIACGLPKWDYVVNMASRDIEMPKEWEKLRGKKVILRNFHYMQDLEDMISGRFAEIEMTKGTDIAYLYRFHPMMETIFNLYRSDLKDRWEELKRAINSSENLVIDENISYDCAFKFSDVFLTTPTSLIFQYLPTKKPVMTIFWGYMNEQKKFEENENIFAKYTELYTINDMEDKKRLLNTLLDGKDPDYDKRMKFIEDNMPNLDGKIGERLSAELINEMLKEDGVFF